MSAVKRLNSWNPRFHYGWVIGPFTSILFFQDTVSILVFSLPYGFTFPITAPLTMVFAAKMFGPARLGTVSGLMSMVHRIAGGAGAVAGGLTFDLHRNYYLAFVLMLALSIVAAAATAMVRENRFLRWRVQRGTERPAQQAQWAQAVRAQFRAYLRAIYWDRGGVEQRGENGSDRAVCRENARALGREPSRT